MAYQQLATTKYWNEKVTKEMKMFRRQRGKEAMQSFRSFLFCLTIIAATFWAYQTMPEWLPQVTAFVETSDFTQRFFSGLAKVQVWLGIEQLPFVSN